MAGVLAVLACMRPPAAHAAFDGTLTRKGTLHVCSAINLPPMEFLGADTQPAGVDIDLGDAIGKQLGLKTVWVNMPFAGLIPALLAGHCDAIMSQLFIKPDRLKVIDEVLYMVSHEAVLMKKGAPPISGLADLSGMKAATVTGTTATILLQKESAALQAAGKKPIDIVMFPENTQALQQVEFGQVAAYGVAYETARYYVNKAPQSFQLGGQPYFRVETGIGLRKDETALNGAIRKALMTLHASGEYAAIMKKWDLAIDMVPNPGQ
ncbi:MAG: ABC transporter substrate-binding protein [Rhodospirillales bacterium]|nr:ABC transporter substrate-binding protein [Rhodospirillales bacterium]